MLKGTVYYGMEYQGYRAVSGNYCRSDGLRPERGEVVLRLSDLKKIQILPKEIPWRPVEGTEFDGGLDIRTWKRFQGKATVTADRPAIPAPKGGGLNQFGDLIIRTFSYPSGKVLDEITYKDVYVDHGMEEITRGMANVLDHEEGQVRVPLTDIRRYFGKLGGFIGRINCRRKVGTWDLETVKDGGEAYTLQEILEFLFSQLPGSPTIHKGSDLYKSVTLGSKYDPPQGVEGKGEPVAQMIEKILERFALKAQMQPNGSFAINRRFSPRLKDRHIATDVGASRDATADLHYERLTSSPTDRPPALTAIGPRRVQRVSVPYVAVLQDTDGRWYTLEALCKRWDYNFYQLKRQVLADSRRNFDDVKPPLGIGNDQLHEQRRHILAGAYRFYLPAFLFKNLAAGVDVEDIDLDLVPLLPMVDAPWYLTELDKEFLKRLPTDKAQKGDLGKYQLMGPVARGVTIGRALFTDFAEVENLYKAHVRRINETAAFFSEQRRDYLKKAEQAGTDLLASERVSVFTLIAHEVSGFGVELEAPRAKSDVKAFGVGSSEFALDIGGDTEKALKELGFVMPERERIKATTESVTARELLKVYSACAAQQRTLEEEQRLLLTRWSQPFEELKEVWGKNHKIPLNFNRPQTTIEANIDSKTGLLKSSSVLCQISNPFYFDGDSKEVVGDGCVQVTYGVELKGSLMSAFTNYLFFADDGGDPDEVADVKFGGCHRSGPIKSEFIPMESREYIQDNGNPVNYNACWSEAKGKCAAILAQPRRVDGRVLELKGLRKCVLDAGIMSVQHDWDGEKGLTHVAINAPNAAMPLRQPAQPKRDTGAVDRRENDQRESEG